MNKQLQAVSHVIELKKNRRYIFVFEKGAVSKEDMKRFVDLLREIEFIGIGIILTDVNGLRVFEKEV